MLRPYGVPADDPHHSRGQPGRHVRDVPAAVALTLPKAAAIATLLRLTRVKGCVRRQPGNQQPGVSGGDLLPSRWTRRPHQIPRLSESTKGTGEIRFPSESFLATPAFLIPLAPADSHSKTLEFRCRENAAGSCAWQLWQRDGTSSRTTLI